jgi:MFS family permease
MLGYVSNLFTGLRGTAFSLVFFIAVTGNIIVNYLTGFFARQYGIRTFPAVLLVCTGFLALFLAVVLRKFRDKIHSV